MWWSIRSCSPRCRQTRPRAANDAIDVAGALVGCAHGGDCGGDSTLRGMVSADIQRSLDRVRLANHAHWRSREHFEAILRNPEAIPHIRADEAKPVEMSGFARERARRFELLTSSLGNGCSTADLRAWQPA
jgi:hypothetical protein